MFLGLSSIKVLSIIGTETRASVRVPASYCGILGFQPSHDVISTAGVIPMSQSFDTVGKESTIRWLDLKYLT